jgi:hypothetical protein
MSLPLIASLILLDDTIDEDVLIMIAMHVVLTRVRKRSYLTRIHRTIASPSMSAWSFVQSSRNDMAYIVTCGLTVDAFDNLHKSFARQLKWYV